MSALPQVFATDDELAASDAMRDTASMQQAMYTQQAQHQYGNTFAQQQQQYSPSHTQQMQQQQQYSPSHSQQQSSAHRTASPFQASARSSLASTNSPHQTQQMHATYQPSTSRRSGSYEATSPHSQSHPHSHRHVQRPQTGIASVPKMAQSSWQSIVSRGAYQYNGDTYRAALQSHMLTVTPASGHADGPQHLDNAAELETLPDAPHRQAWSNQPTFRWFKRHAYDDVPDRWAKKEGLKGRVGNTERQRAQTLSRHAYICIQHWNDCHGDNTYRPLSVREQAEINMRVERRKATKGPPRVGEW